MAVQSTGGNSLGALNPHCLRNVLDLCSRKDKYSLRSCSTDLRSAIQPIPQEAKAFLVFESKRPLIREIVRMTDWNRHLTRPVNLSYSAWKYTAMCLVSSFLAMKIMTNQEQVEAPGDSGGDSLMVIIAVIVAAYAVPRFICCMEGNLGKAVLLMQLWHELNGEIPENLLDGRARLLAEEEVHVRLARAYSSAGGMDRYYAQPQFGYTEGGLDHTLNGLKSAYYRTDGLDRSLERMRAMRSDLDSFFP